MQAGVAESCGFYCLHEHIKSLEIVTAPSVQSGTYQVVKLSPPKEQLAQ
ncbi:hypothetical protein [Paenibacillus kribbensis]|nr:hypothetical protein [Paenibacillus kribbensis]